MMNIGLNNYEEYFLLYVDNELSDAQRAEVNFFLSEHPELKTELEILQQAVLRPDATEEMDKSLLMFSDANRIHTGNCEEWFLLYADNELSPAQRKMVEVFVLQHPELQQSFDMILNTVLPCEELVYPYKKDLYRQEEKRRPVLYFSLSKLAVAASVTAVAVAGWLLFTKPEGTKVEFTAKRPTTVQGQPSSSGAAPSVTPATTPGKEASTPVVEETSETYIAVANPTIKPIKVEKPTAPKQLVTELPLTEAPVEQSFATAQKPVEDQEFEALKKMVLETPAHEMALNTDETIGGKLKQMKVIDIDEDDNDNSLLIGNLQVNKRKVNGILSSARQLLKGNSTASK